MQKQLRATLHYDRSNREAMEVNGQTLLRVQRNGLKIGNKILIFKYLVGCGVKPPNLQFLNKLLK